MELEDADGIEKEQFSYLQQLSELISWAAFCHPRKAGPRLCNTVLQFPVCVYLSAVPFSVANVRNLREVIGLRCCVNVFE